MGIQVVQHEVNALGLAVAHGEFEECHGETVGGAIRRRPREVASSFRFYGAEHIGRSTAFVFGVPFGNMTGGRRTWRAHIGAQGRWLLIKANYGFSGIQRTLVN